MEIHLDAPKYNELFLDSGAHTLYNIHVGSMQNKAGYAYYDTPKFFAFVDQYANFVKANLNTIDYYANVDVIYDPVRSWKVQKYLEEKHDLNPIPVIHWGADMSWVDKHLEAGYTYLGIGGLGQGVTEKMYLAWADKLFSRICPAPDYLPVVRTHGFAMTSYRLLWRYPWFSADSATWTKLGANGSILVPKMKKDKFVFNKKPYIMIFSNQATTHGRGRYYLSLSGEEQNVLKAWLSEINVPVGNKTEQGLVNNHSARKLANLMFFEYFRKELPEYPWPFKLPKTSHNTRTRLVS